MGSIQERLKVTVLSIVSLVRDMFYHPPPFLQSGVSLINVAFLFLESHYCYHCFIHRRNYSINYCFYNVQRNAHWRLYIYVNNI